MCVRGVGRRFRGVIILRSEFSFFFFLSFFDVRGRRGANESRHKRTHEREGEEGEENGEEEVEEGKTYLTDYDSEFFCCYFSFFYDSRDVEGSFSFYLSIFFSFLVVAREVVCLFGFVWFGLLHSIDRQTDRGEYHVSRAVDV